MMKRRVLGKTNLAVSMLGLGGFHLLEIPTRQATELVERYLDAGGNYLETAASYGDGESERKLGKVLKTRRNECVLTTKTGKRDAAGCIESLERSLRNLNTDYVDILFMHSVGSMQDLDEILRPGGAIEGFLRMRDQGKARFLAISVHGHPATLIEAIKRYPFDACMSTINYYDRCNFPEIEEELIPLCVRENVGLMAMKPLADGYLWQSVEPAFRYVWSIPGISIVVAGANSREMLEKDIDMANRFVPMSEDEREQLFRQAPELGDYVCRQCKHCRACANAVVKEVFRLEGVYDRQMRDGKPRTPPEYALRDRLRFWFGNKDFARAQYAELGMQPNQICDGCDEPCGSRCPYGLPITFKLKYAHYKLTGDVESF